MIEPGAMLPTGVIVATAVIERVVEVRDQKSEVRHQKSEVRHPNSLTSDLRPLISLYEWHLTDVRRVRTFRKPRGHPPPVWFNPF